MDNSGFQKIKEIEFTENSARPSGIMRPRMFRQAMIKDRDNNIYAVYGDRLKKGTPDVEILPWGITLTSDGSGYKGTVWPGTVAGILPSNVFSNGVLAEFSVGASLMKWKVKCLTDGKQITSVQIVVDASDPPAQVLVPSALPAEATLVFGVTFEGAAYRTIGPGNPGVVFNQAVVTDKTSSPPLGIPGVDRWYNIIFQ